MSKGLNASRRGACQGTKSPSLATKVWAVAKAILWSAAYTCHCYGGGCERDGPAISATARNFASTSSGRNVHAATPVSKKLGPSANVVTLMIDSGLKYVSTDLYRSVRS
jgi:hypothetical protein